MRNSCIGVSYFIKPYKNVRNDTDSLYSQQKRNARDSAYGPHGHLSARELPEKYKVLLLVQSLNEFLNYDAYRGIACKKRAVNLLTAILDKNN